MSFNPSKPLDKTASVRSALSADESKVADAQESNLVLPGAMALPDTPLPKTRSVNMHFVRNKAGEEHTIMVGLKDILPEDFLWRKENPRVPAMVCLQQNNACACTFNCMSRFAERCMWLFQRFPEVIHILVFFKRSEADLIRNEPQYAMLRKELAATGGGVLDIGKKQVPRLWVIRVPQDFQLGMYRINHDGLKVSLKGAIKRSIETPYFW